jgi:hypothetical protein
VEHNEAQTVPDVSESGLEATAFVCGVDERTLAKTLMPESERPLPVPQSVADLWRAHGFRIVAAPTESVDALMGELRSNGGTQKQWLGQAYTWTEVVRSADASSKVVALDAERIRLPAVSLRLLARSWLEPAAQRSDGGAPAANLHVELVPQNRETRRSEDAMDPLSLGHPSIDAESQGMMFTRLYASMSLAPGQSILVIPERPDADWKALGAEPAPSDDQPANAGESGGPGKPHGAPRIGQVVRSTPSAGSGHGAKDATDAMPEGPIGPRVLTLGEALLLVDPGSAGSRSARNPERTILVLTPHLPKEFRLLPERPRVTPSLAAPSEGPWRRG